MTTVTHALAPVIIVRLLSASSGSFKLSKWDYIWIAIAGGLADVINPHYYLKDRLTSWSHGLPFWGLFTVFLLLVAIFAGERFRYKIAMYCSLAYLFHLFCDAISGGINMFYPVRDYFIGTQWVPFKYWIPLDVVNVLLVYFLFRRIKKKA